MSRNRLTALIDEALASRGSDALREVLCGAVTAEADAARAESEACEPPRGAPSEAASPVWPEPVLEASVEPGREVSTFTGTASWVITTTLEDTATSSASLQSMLNTTKDAIVAIAPDGRVLSANAAAARLLGTPIETLLGASIAPFLPSLPLCEDELAAFATRYDDVDGLPELVEARRGDDEAVTVELTVSRMAHEGQTCFILCARDVTERLQDLQALRDSEARYRALVENAPEAILVLDVDRNRFVDANENAVRLFKMSRSELLAHGPEAISPKLQADGSPSFGSQRGYVERALKGSPPVFEWLHRDAEGKTFPCEVRFIRLPSSKRRLIRASVTDIIARAAAARERAARRADGGPSARSRDALRRIGRRARASSLRSYRCAVSRRAQAARRDPGGRSLRGRGHRRPAGRDHGSSQRSELS